MIVAALMAVNSCQQEELTNPLEEESVVLKSASVSVEDIDAVIAKINDYVDGGMLDPGLANSLVSKLENAKKTLESCTESASGGN